MDESERPWFDDLRTTLETAYLSATDPRAQSGFRGDAARWERGRRVIAAAIDRDGSFLDIGCANGLLMETLTDWAAADGRRIEPHGLDLSAGLADLARRRLLRWADRIWVGNALDWLPPCRFDFVRTELVYVPEARRREYLDRLLREFVTPAGRLIVCAYGSARRPEARVGDPAAELRALWFEPAGTAEAADPNGIPITRVVWLTAPGPSSGGAPG